MKLSEQVVSLELAKRLKELGVKQESYFHYWKTGYTAKEGAFLGSVLEANYHKTKEFHDEPGANNTFDPISAFTVSELLDFLPQIITIKSVNYQIFISAGLDKQFFIVYANEKNYRDNAPFPIIMRRSLPESLARMLIYLLEKKLIPYEKD